MNLQRHEQVSYGGEYHGFNIVVRQSDVYHGFVGTADEAGLYGNKPDGKHFEVHALTLGDVKRELARQIDGYVGFQDGDTLTAEALNEGIRRAIQPLAARVSALEALVATLPTT